MQQISILSPILYTVTFFLRGRHHISCPAEHRGSRTEALLFISCSPQSHRILHSLFSVCYVFKNLSHSTLFLFNQRIVRGFTVDPNPVLTEANSNRTKQKVPNTDSVTWIKKNSTSRKEMTHKGDSQQPENRSAWTTAERRQLHIQKEHGKRD